MRDHFHIAVIIPALNEKETIDLVLSALPDWVDLAVVADNGSTDGTPELAAAAGATVVHQPRRGYGAACLRGMEQVAEIDVPGHRIAVVFLDGDFSDDPTEMHRLVDPIVDDTHDFVLGSRLDGPCEKGALSVAQRFGSHLSSLLMRILYDVRYADLGPFRAVRWDKLEAMEMDDLDFGWTVQMQARAAKLKLRILEVPVTYRNRAGGRSKVSGTVRGVWGAGTTILRVIFKEAGWRPGNGSPTTSNAILAIGKQVTSWISSF